MIREQLVKIKNSRGEPVMLNEMEQQICDWVRRDFNARFGNSLGFEIPITTLTTILKAVSEQKFYDVAPADFMPVMVGDGAWSDFLTSYRSFQVGDNFETGVINMGGDDSKLATMTAAVDAVTTRVYDWAKKITWTMPELKKAMLSGNWDVVESKERARKENWDLGIQRVAFLGMRGNNTGTSPACPGLLNVPGCTVDTTTITGYINNLAVANLKTFCTQVLEKYRANCNRTAWPTHWLVPESEFNGLASPSSADFPIKSTLAQLQETFALITRRPNFKILPCAYADPAYNGDVFSGGKHVYALYNGEDQRSLRLNIPVDYNATQQQSIDGFSLQNVGYGEFTGVTAPRPLELYYFQW